MVSSWPCKRQHFFQMVYTTIFLIHNILQYGNLPINVNVDVELLAVPTGFTAAHTYVPASEAWKLFIVNDGVVVVPPVYFAGVKESVCSWLPPVGVKYQIILVADGMPDTVHCICCDCRLKTLALGGLIETVNKPAEKQ